MLFLRKAAQDEALLDMLTLLGAVYRYDDYDGAESLNRTETRAIEVTSIMGGRSPAQPGQLGSNVNEFRLAQVSRVPRIE